MQQHSYEALDRPGGFSKTGLLTPLRHRDFRVLWAGMTVSLLGDGIFLVAIAWESYLLWNTPAALSIVGIGLTVPTILFLLLGGVVTDRCDRRHVMLASDGVRAAAVVAIAVLILTGALQFWMLVALVAVYGAGMAFFIPAFEAIIPDLLPRSELPAANSLDQLVRPITLRLAGPLLGGGLVAVGPAIAFFVDAASFGASFLAVLAMRARPSLHAGEESALDAMKEGFRFVRQRVWLWGTLLSAGATYFVFLGPSEVLLPYLVKNDLGGSAGTLGLVFAAGGVGAVFAAIWIARAGHPRSEMTFIYLTWTLATLAIAGYGLSTTAWQLMIAAFVFSALETVGLVAWTTVKQRRVPSRMLGRVSSLDWLISIGLVPVSFALTAPVVALVGTRATLIGAGILGAAITFAALFLPGMRDPDPEPEPEPDERTRRFEPGRTGATSGVPVSSAN